MILQEKNKKYDVLLKRSIESKWGINGKMLGLMELIIKHGTLL